MHEILYEIKSKMNKKKEIICVYRLEYVYIYMHVCMNVYIYN